MIIISIFSFKYRYWDRRFFARKLFHQYINVFKYLTFVGKYRWCYILYNMKLLMLYKLKHFQDILGWLVRIVLGLWLCNDIHSSIVLYLQELNMSQICLCRWHYILMPSSLPSGWWLPLWCLKSRSDINYRYLVSSLKCILDFNYFIYILQY